MKNLLKTFSKSKLALALTTGILLSACGGTDQDEGTISTSEQVFGGKAIDGSLARATVYIDTNNDGTRNAWEPSAFTDNEGYYSYNPNTDTNYCAEDAEASQKIYCLVTNSNLTEAVIRIDGGYDILTGEPFVGQLSRRFVDIPSEGVRDSIITPITSLLTSVEEPTEQASLLSTLGLSESDIDVDYLNTDGSGTIDSLIFNVALKVHKVVSVLSDRLTDTYDEIGEELGTPNDATSSVYPSFAEQLLTSQTSINSVISDSIQVANILDNAENSLRDLYVRKDINLPADMGSAENPNNFSRVINVSQSVNNVVDLLIPPNAFLDAPNAIGSARAIETLVIKSLNEVNNDPSIESMVSFFNNESSDLVNALLTSLSLDTADITSLAGNDFSGTNFDTVEEIIQASSLPENTQAFTSFSGLSLKISDLDLGTWPNNLEDKEVEFYFSGSAEALEGSFSACVKYIDDASSDGTLGDGNTRGELIEGYWSFLGASESGESYGTLVTLTFLETTYQAILKPAGNETLNGVDYERIRFDFDGELNVYNSEDGLVTTDTIPTTNQECQERLPSRVGL